MRRNSRYARPIYLLDISLICFSSRALGIGLHTIPFTSARVAGVIQAAETRLSLEANARLISSRPKQNKSTGGTRGNK